MSLNQLNCLVDSCAIQRDSENNALQSSFIKITSAIKQPSEKSRAKFFFYLLKGISSTQL
jgi:hypothetical protein